MRLNPDWFTRVGILLDFFAGILLTPEVVGERALRRMAVLLRRPAVACWRFLTPESRSVLLLRWVVAYAFAHLVASPCVSLACWWSIQRFPRLKELQPLSCICGSFTGIVSWITVLAALVIASRSSKLLADSAGLRKVLLRIGVVLFILGSMFGLLGTM